MSITKPTNQLKPQEVTSPLQNEEPQYKLAAHDLSGTSAPDCDAPVLEQEAPLGNLDQSRLDPVSIEDSYSLTTMKLSRWRWTLMHVTVWLTAIMLGYDVGNIANVQIPIYSAFGHIELLPWVVASFSLANAAVAPLARRIMDLMDAKWYLVASLVISAGGAAAVGAAGSIQTVISGRLLLGIGMSGTYISVLKYARALTTATDFARLNGLIGMGIAIGLIGGPILGGAFAENQRTTWRWASYIQIPYTGLLILLYLLWLPSMPSTRKGTVLQGLVDIDWVGACLHIASLVLLVVALLFSGTIWAWQSGASIALWVLSGVLVMAYILQQKYCLVTTPNNRIFPVTVLSSRTGASILLSTSCSSAAYAVTLYYLPLYYAFTRGDSPVQSGVHMLPYLCVFIALSLIAGILLPRIRYYAALYLVGGILITAGTGAMMAVNLDTPTSMVMGLTSLIGAGVGLTFQLGTATLGALLPVQLQVDSLVALNQAQYASTTISVSLAGCVFQNHGFARLESVFIPLGFTGEEIRDVLAGLKSRLLQSENSDITVLARTIITDEIINLFFFGIAAGSLMIICAGIMKWEALHFHVEQSTDKEPREALVEPRRAKQDTE